MTQIVSICTAGFVALECNCPEPHQEIRVTECRHSSHEGMRHHLADDLQGETSV